MRKIHLVVLIAVLSTLIACQGRQDSSSGATAIARILNGEAIDDATVPQLVRIKLRTAEGAALCTGIVADATHVITAGHCVEGLLESPSIEGFSGEASVHDIQVHPLYRSDYSLGVIFHDLAVLETDPHGLPALPVFRTLLTSGEQFQVLGFGVDDAENWGRLISGFMTLESISAHHLFAFPFSEGSESGSCNGDSGGPAVVKRSYNGIDTYGISGIISTGTLEYCGEGDATAFTNLMHVENVRFLQEQIPGLTILDFPQG